MVVETKQARISSCAVHFIIDTVEEYVRFSSHYNKTILWNCYQKCFQTCCGGGLLTHSTAAANVDQSVRERTKLKNHKQRNSECQGFSEKLSKNNF